MGGIPSSFFNTSHFQHPDYTQAVTFPELMKTNIQDVEKFQETTIDVLVEVWEKYNDACQ